MALGVSLHAERSQSPPRQRFNKDLIPCFRFSIPLHVRDYLWDAFSVERTDVAAGYPPE